MRIPLLVLSLLALALGPATSTLAAAGSAASAAMQFQRAIVMEAAPVFLRPDDTLTPLRQLTTGTTVTVDQVRDDWVQVTFDDPQFGRRTGWIERRFVSLEAPEPVLEDAPPDAPPAQASPPSQPPAPAARRLGIRGFGTVAYDHMSASKSFDALFGQQWVVGYGGGVQVTNIWRGLFVEVSAERSSLDGERVFVNDDESIFPLGIPLEVTMTPLDVVAGWRSAPIGGVTTYGGAGYSSMAYTETSGFADTGEDVDERYGGWVVLGGVEGRLAAWLHLRGEFRYRHIPDALGEGGVSEAFDETRLGGAGVALKIVFGR